jgi:hypothetical protein
VSYNFKQFSNNIKYGDLILFIIRSWSGFGDELGWAAAWLLRATNETTYKTDFDKHWAEFNLSNRPEQFSWDDKRAGLQVLMAKISGDEKYKTATQAYCDWVVNDAPKSAKGMVYLDQWGPLRHASNVAWICLQVYKFFKIFINTLLFNKRFQLIIGCRFRNKSNSL